MNRCDKSRVHNLSSRKPGRNISPADYYGFIAVFEIREIAHHRNPPRKNRSAADAGIKRQVWRGSPMVLPPTGNPPESPQLRALSRRSAYHRDDNNEVRYP